MARLRHAAIKLPANNVGTEQLKKNAVTLKKIKRSTLLADGGLLTSAKRTWAVW